MSVRAMTWVWDHSRSRWPARLVLLAIADNAHDDGAQAWPSMSTLVRKTRLDERTVQRALATLQKLGELHVDPNGGPRRCNLYRVVMATPDTPAERHPGRETPPAERHPRPRQRAGGDPGSVPPEPSIEPSRNHQEQTPSSVVPTDHVSQVWQAWVDSLGGSRGRLRLTPKRQTAIRARLREYPLADVCDAARGWRHDPWPERVNHNDLTVLLRNGEQVEKFRDLYRHGPPATLGKATAAARNTYQQMAAMDPGRENGHGMARVDGHGGEAQLGIPPPAG